MKIAVIGAGLMGRAAAYDLARNNDVKEVGVFDINLSLASEISRRYGEGKTIPAELDATDEVAVAQALNRFDAAVACTTYKHNLALSRAAIQAKCHLVDLGGNNDIVKAQLEMNKEAEAAGVTIIPDCGLAPGMVAVIAADGINHFDSVESLRIRVGGLPQVPRPPLNYQMVFSAEGLINEYWEPCVILENGKQKIVNPMTGVESLEFDGIGQLEAFYTSGGTSTLPDTYHDKIDFLDYKTIRYPGHCNLFKTMLELGLASRKPVTVNGNSVEPRELFKVVLDQNLSLGDPDLVLVRVYLEGVLDGKKSKRVYEIIDRQDSRSDLTAMMRTTAFPAAIITWMAATRKIDQFGVKPQEILINPAIFLPQLKKRAINLNVKEIN